MVRTAASTPTHALRLSRSAVIATASTTAIGMRAGMIRVSTASSSTPELAVTWASQAWVNQW